MNNEEELDRILDLLLTDPDGEVKAAVAGLSTEGQQALLNRAMRRSVEQNQLTNQNGFDTSPHKAQ